MLNLTGLQLILSKCSAEQSSRNLHELCIYEVRGGNFPVWAKYTWRFPTRSCAKNKYTHPGQEGETCYEVPSIFNSAHERNRVGNWSRFDLRGLSRQGHNRLIFWGGGKNDCNLLHGPRKDFFQGGPTRGFFQIFSRGRPNEVKFVFSHSKLRKQPFFAEKFKIQGGPWPPLPPPLPNFRGWHNGRNSLFDLTTKHVFENFGEDQLPGCPLPGCGPASR